MAVRREISQEDLSHINRVGQRGDKSGNLPHSGRSYQLVAGVPVAESDFWKDRQAEFANYAVRLADLHAFWQVDFREWFLWWGSTPKGVVVPQEYKDTFNAIARKAVSKLPDSHAAERKEPWQLWLDFMRRSGWGFRVTGQVACTEREWDLGVHDGNPLIQVRQEQGYTERDEWTKVYRRTKRGKLRRLSARELKHKSSEDLQKYYHFLESGSIEHVFESSAQFCCEELASRAFESETAERHSSGLPTGGLLPETKLVKPKPADDGLMASGATSGGGGVVMVARLLDLVPSSGGIAFGRLPLYTCHIGDTGQILGNRQTGLWEEDGQGKGSGLPRHDSKKWLRMSAMQAVGGFSFRITTRGLGRSFAVHRLSAGAADGHRT